MVKRGSRISYLDAARAYQKLLYDSKVYWAGVIIAAIGGFLMLIAGKILSLPFAFFSLGLAVFGLLFVFVAKWKIAKEPLKF